MLLKECCFLVKDKIDSKKLNKLNYISTENLNSNFNGFSEASSLPCGNVTRVQSGDILISNIRPYFKKGLFCCFDGGCSNDVFCIRNNSDSYINKYLYYALCSDCFIDKLVMSCKGTKMPRGDKNVLLNYNLPDIDIAKQQHIVNILGSIDEKIENNSNLINKYNYLMGCNLLANSKTDTRQLKEMCSLITKGTTPTTLGKKFVSTGISFIKAESILENHIIDDNKISFIDNDTHELLKRSQMQEYDILLSIAGTIGRFSFISQDYIPANTNQAVSIIRPNNIMDFIHIYSYFCSEKQNIYFNEQTVQGVQANISLATVGNTPIPLLMDNKILEENLLIFDKLMLAVNENKKLNKLKQLYLKKFFG